MTWLLRLWANPLFQKIALYAAIAVGLFLVFRWYGNREFYIGKEEGRVAATTEIQKAKEAEWKAKEDQIAAERIKVANSQSELMRSRQQITQTLSEITARAYAGKTTIGGQVAVIPANDLIPAIRALSAELGPPAIK